MKNVFCSGVVMGALMLVQPAVALDGLEKLSVTETINIAAPADKVWQRVIGFDGVASWIPGITRNELIAGEANQPGAVRKLYFDDASLTEELTAIDQDKMTLQYRITEDNVDLLPATHYSSIISVVAKGADDSEVTWSGSFYRGFPESNPPQYLTDEAAIKGVTGIYQAGLNHLKQEMEAKQ